MSSVWFAFASRSQTLGSAGVGSALFGSGRMPSGRDTPVLLQHAALQKTDFRRAVDQTVLLVRSRRTMRLDCIIHHLGLALGGRPAASFAKRLMLPVSNDTVLRVVRARARPRTEPLNVVGIDDWAFRRNHSYGTIVCDLERRRIVTLLPDREMATVRAWLVGHPGIKVLSRDRGGGYGEAASKALPCAIQVADRWHLMENASAAFLVAVRKSMRPIRAAIGATTINPASDLRGTTAIRVNRLAKLTLDRRAILTHLGVQQFEGSKVGVERRSKPRASALSYGAVASERLAVIKHDFAIASCRCPSR